MTEKELEEILLRTASVAYRTEESPQYWKDHMAMIREIQALWEQQKLRTTERDLAREERNALACEVESRNKQLKDNPLPEGETEPEHDYALMVTHRFPSIYEQMKLDDNMGSWEFQSDNREFVEKVVWVFVCRKTGKMIEVVHKGPL